MVCINELLNVDAGISGFENPTKSYLDKPINLNELFIHNPSSTKIIEAPNSLKNYGVFKGDWLIVNANLKSTINDLVFANVDGTLGVAPYSYMLKVLSEEITIIGVVPLSIRWLSKPDTLPVNRFLSDVNFHELLIKQEYSTVLCRANGMSMLPNIWDKDLMILERHLEPKESSCVILGLNNNLVVKRISFDKKVFYSDNPQFKIHQILQSDRIQMHGVVNKVLRLHRNVG